jgi:hypothetical protein
MKLHLLFLFFTAAYAGCLYTPDSNGHVTIPDGVTEISSGGYYSNLNGELNFNGCGDLKTITIPSSVTSIGDMAFSMSGLVSVAIPNTVASIGQSTFVNCAGLTSVVIPHNITTIGANAFYDCPSLTSVSYSVAGLSTSTVLGEGGIGFTPTQLSPADITSLYGSCITGISATDCVALGDAYNTQSCETIDCIALRDAYNTQSCCGN